jgi:hypothetical protein
MIRGKQEDTVGSVEDRQEVQEEEEEEEEEMKMEIWKERKIWKATNRTKM